MRVCGAVVYLGRSEYEDRGVEGGRQKLVFSNE